MTCTLFHGRKNDVRNKIFCNDIYFTVYTCKRNRRHYYLLRLSRYAVKTKKERAMSVQLASNLFIWFISVFDAKSFKFIQINENNTYEKCHQRFLTDLLSHVHFLAVYKSQHLFA